MPPIGKEIDGLTTEDGLGVPRSFPIGEVAVPSFTEFRKNYPVSKCKNMGVLEDAKTGAGAVYGLLFTFSPQSEMGLQRQCDGRMQPVSIHHSWQMSILPQRMMAGAFRFEASQCGR